MQADEGIRDAQESRGRGDVYTGQVAIDSTVANTTAMPVFSVKVFFIFVYPLF